MFPFRPDIDQTYEANVKELCVSSMDKSRGHKKTTGLVVMICEIRLLWRCLIPEALNPLSPHDALKHQFSYNQRF